MKNIHVISKTSGQTAPQLLEHGRNIIAALNKNSSFPNLYPPLTRLEDEVNTLKTAIDENRKGDKLATLRLQNAMELLRRTLKVLAAHVEYESNNDQEKALSSGFHLRQLTQRSASGFEVNYGEHSGTVDLKCPRSKGASYVWEYAMDPTVNWINAGTTVNTKFRITALTPGAKYWFRVSVVDKTGQHAPCDPLMVMVI